MARVKEFVQQVEVSPAFMKQHPGFLDEELRRLASENEYATGPRGGRYRLLPVPIKWNLHEDQWDGTLTFWQRRPGRYVRPAPASEPGEGSK